MRKLILGMFMSLDGFVSGPNGEADWIFKAGDDATDEWIVDNLWQAGLIAMGSRSYADMAGYWPTSDTPFAAPMNATPKIVFTRKGLQGTSGTEEKGSWANPFVADGDLAGEIARLKAQSGKDIRALGGASFAQALAAGGLVDEYHLIVCPVALGKGLPLFSEVSRPVDLQLVSARTFGSGAIGMVYRTS